MCLGWPVRLGHGRVGVRPTVRSDARKLDALRAANRDWLGPWDATVPAGTPTPIGTHAALIAFQRRKAREGLMMPFVVTWDREVVGQLTVNSIARGSAMSSTIGYWIARSHAGLGITTLAVALVSDHLLTTAGLHRVEIAIRPENAASLRVVEKLGFDEVGLARGYIHIDGQWRDHRVFQVVSEDVHGTLVSRALASGGSQNM